MAGTLEGMKVERAEKYPMKSKTVQPAPEEGWNRARQPKPNLLGDAPGPAMDGPALAGLASDHNLSIL